MLVNDLQFKNAEPPIEVTLFGISMFVNDVQLSNAYLPIVVTLLGISTLVNEQSPNAKSPIAVTLMPLIVDGITTLVSVPVYLVIVPLLL